MELGIGYEAAEDVLWREKWPSWGLKWREKVGIMELGAELEREKLAEKTRGESRGEPNRPNPDLREREKGEGEAVEGE